MADSSRESIALTTSDDRELAATIYRPGAGRTGVIVLAPALAIARQFYRPIAEWFADRGYAVLTFDYRGLGGSTPPDPPDSPATITDWAERDLPAAVAEARGRFDGDTTFLFGHSLGGQFAGTLGDRFDLRALVTFSAQSGYWRLQHPGHRLKMLVVMGALVPAVARLLGYLPWSRVIGGEDIPGPAALQWADWCLNPDYLMGDRSLPSRRMFREFTAPVLAYSFEDDTWGYREAVDWMMDRYCNAALERIHLAPDDVGLDRIGHFGFFRRRAEPLWYDLLDRMEALE